MHHLILYTSLMILVAEVPHPLPAGGAGSELLAKTVRPLTESAVRFVCAAAAAGCAAPCVGGGRDAIVASQAEPVDAKSVRTQKRWRRRSLDPLAQQLARFAVAALDHFEAAATSN